MNVTAAAENPLKLIIADRPIVGIPTPDEIRQRLAFLYDPKDTFVLLCGKGRYLQCSGTPDDGFAVEFCDGSGHPPYRAAERAVDIDVTAALFISYLNGDERWREMVRWVPKGADPDPNAKRGFRLVEREGDRLIINKRWCLITLGIIITLIGGATFFLQNDVTFVYASILPGCVMAAGFVVMLLSTMTDD